MLRSAGSTADWPSSPRPNRLHRQWRRHDEGPEDTLMPDGIKRESLLPEDMQFAISHAGCSDQQAHARFHPQRIEVDLIRQERFEWVHVEGIELIRR